MADAKNPSAYLANVVARLKDSKRKVQEQWEQLVQRLAVGTEVPDAEILATINSANKSPEELQFDVESAARIQQARIVVQRRPELEKRQKAVNEAINANNERLKTKRAAAETEHETERLRLDSEQTQIVNELEQVRLADVLLSAHDNEYSKRKRLLERIERTQARVNWTKDKLLQLEQQQAIARNSNSLNRLALIETEIDGFKEQLEAFAQQLVLDMDSLEKPTGQPAPVRTEDVAARLERKRTELKRRRDLLDSLEFRVGAAAQAAAVRGLEPEEQHLRRDRANSMREIADAEKKAILELQREILEFESMLVVPAPG